MNAIVNDKKLNENAIKNEWEKFFKYDCSTNKNSFWVIRICTIVKWTNCVCPFVQ